MKSTLIAVLYSIVVLYGITDSVIGISKTLKTSGRDVTYELTTTVPVNLYGESHSSLFVSRFSFIFI